VLPGLVWVAGSEGFITAFAPRVASSGHSNGLLVRSQLLVIERHDQ
jgi:hypothetical protein